MLLVACFVLTRCFFYFVAFMFESNLSKTSDGEERGDRLAKSQEITAIADQLQFTDSLFHSFSENISPCHYYSVDTKI